MNKQDLLIKIQEANLDYRSLELSNALIMSSLPYKKTKINDKEATIYIAEAQMNLNALAFYVHVTSDTSHSIYLKPDLKTPIMSCVFNNSSFRQQIKMDLVEYLKETHIKIIRNDFENLGLRIIKEFAYDCKIDIYLNDFVMYACDNGYDIDNLSLKTITTFTLLD